MIRLLVPEDFAAWKTIRLEALREHPAAYGGSYEESAQCGDLEWAESLKTSNLFAFEEEGIFVGVAGYFFRDTLKERHRATVFTVYVKASHRGKGVMDWLLGAIEYHARYQGIEQLHLKVGTYNDSAIRCYERNGFAAYGTDPRAIKLDEGYIDEYLMVKYI